MYPLPPASRTWRAVVATLLVLLVSVVVGAPAMARGTPDGFADLAEQLLPAVVNISTSQTVGGNSADANSATGSEGGGLNDLLKPFLDKPEAGSVPHKVTSLGSGFIIDPDGYVVTNNHVIENADEITVILSDNTALKATVVGRDSKVDVALLKVDAKRRLPAVAWGNSDKARVGDWVIAIGNPFGLGGSVSAGIISAKTRDISAGPYDSFIQTDAAINRGNSGGPLFNMDGQVIGINTAIYSPDGGSVGIGFATPSSIAKLALDDIRQFGHTRRGWIGLKLQTVTPDISESLGLSSSAGALVAGIEPDSPAAAAGFLPGDVVLEYDGTAITEMRRLPGMIAETEIGRSVPVVVWRNGARKSIDVTIVELKGDQTQVAQNEKPKPVPAPAKPAPAPAPAPAPTPAPAPAPPAAPPAVTSAGSLLGLTAVPLESHARKVAKLPPDAKGLMVTDVKSNGPAAWKDIKIGELIVEAAQKPVGTPAEFDETIRHQRDAGQKTVLLLVQNGASLRFVAVPIGDK